MTKDEEMAEEIKDTPGKYCGNCISYLTDEDDNGKVTDFHHDRNKDSGFCALRDLFYNVEKDEKPCKDWEYDNGENS